MRPTRALASAATVLLLVVGLAACGSGGKTSTGSAGSGGGPYGGGASSTTTAAPASGGDAISIKGFAFSPATLKVAKGATVTVTNDDSTSHTWTFDDGSFDAGTLAPGKSATHTFDAAGSYSYHCNIHSSMKGTVEVR
jgi:plastocyanin